VNTQTLVRPAVAAATPEPPRPGRRGRATLALGAVAAFGLAAAAAAGAVVLTGGDDAPAGATTTHAAGSAGSAGAAKAPGDSPGRSEVPAQGSGQSTAGDDAPAAGQQPGAAPVREFGRLVRVERSGDTVILVVDRERMLTGAAAEAWWKAHPQYEPEQSDFAIDNVSERLRRYPLTDHAVLVAQRWLRADGGDRTGAERLTPEQLVERSAGIEVHLWLVHQGSADGPVTQLTEAVLP
jgi:hypothetical protein